jgi:phage gpG-like protein
MGKNLKSLNFDILVKADQHLQQNVPKIIGERARRFFELSFANEGFNDRSLTKWRKRKKETKRSRGKKVLSGTGFLKNSIRRSKTTRRQVVISSLGVSYAGFHNDGTGRAPQRQFIGNSTTLERGLQKRIEHELKKIIKP